MRVAVIGATGVVGSAVVPTIVAAGHDVVGSSNVGDHDGLVRLLEGADAVCNLATRAPVGFAALRRGAWRADDRLRTDGVRRVVAAAREAGVRRIVQESASTLYADGGDAWVTEDSPVAITRATEPTSVGESHVQAFGCESRTAVVLRLGTLVGDDPMTRFRLRSLRHGHPVGFGDPAGWAHVVHADDLGPAVLAALTAPSGTYNVGAAPVRRADLVATFAEAAGRRGVDLAGPVVRRLAGARLEPLERSLRVSSDRFTAATGWTPLRAELDPGWLEDVVDAGRSGAHRRRGHVLTRQPS